MEIKIEIVEFIQKYIRDNKLTLEYFGDNIFNIKKSSRQTTHSIINRNHIISIWNLNNMIVSLNDLKNGKTYTIELESYEKSSSKMIKLTGANPKQAIIYIVVNDMK